MDEEHEVLDWGNEDDEQQQVFYNDAAGGGLAARPGDLDDAEDSVSLGEEEDYQDYYAQPSQAFNADIAGKNSIPAASPRPRVSSASPHQHPAQATEGLNREDSATSQNSPKQSIGSPLTKEKSTSQQSPHRSRSFSATTRLTHALPPKPVAISVPFLHPSHPSIVEATAMSTRLQGRSESNKSTVNGNTAPTVIRAGSGGKRSSSVGAVEADSLPPNWEIRHPRNGGGVYFYNIETSQSTWTRPASSSDTVHHFRESRSDRERHRRGSNVSAGDPSLSQLRSDHPQYQEHTRPRHGQPTSEVSIPDASQSVSLLGGLSYEDRHYRPGEPENSNTSVVERSRGDRIREDYQEAHYNLRPDDSFTPPHSPPQFRRRERSLSPSLPTSVSRGRDSRPHRSMRRRGDHTDADLSMQRDRDLSQVAPVPPRQHWNQPFNSPVEPHDHRQGSRRQQRQTIYEPSAASEGRSSLRNGNGRVRHRDSDHSRIVEPDEGSRTHDQNTSAIRPRSLPPQGNINQTYGVPRTHEPHTPAIVTPSISQALPPSPPPPLARRKRDRPTRFDQPSTSTPSVPPPTAATLPTAVAQIQASVKQLLEDDPYVPDDILAETRRDVETIQDKLMSSVSPQVPARSMAVGSGAPSYPPAPLQPGPDVDHHLDRGYPPPSAAQGRSSPNPEMQIPLTGRKRVPLPPQEDRFREISSRPRSAADRGPRQGSSSHPPPPYPPSAQHQTQAPSESRFPNSCLSNAFPGTLPNHLPVRGDNVSRSDTYLDGSGIKSDKGIGQGDGHTSTTRHPLPLIPAEPMDIEVSERVASSRIPPSSSGHSPAEDIAQSGSAIFVGEAPRGPRAMSSTNPGIPDPEPTSMVPIIPHISDNRGGRIPERGRSPQPDPLSRGSQDGRVLEVSRPSAAVKSDDRHPPDGGYQWRREPRVYSGDSARTTLAPASGTNSIPVGARRTGGGSSNTPGVAPADAGHSINATLGSMGNANARPARGSRGRGGGLPPQRDSYRAPAPTPNDERVNSHRFGRFETGGPHHRVRDRNLPPLDKLSLSVNTTVMRDSGPHSAGNSASRHDASSLPDSLKNQPRVWIPRGESPPRELLRGNVGGGESDGRGATLPPSSKESSLHVSPSWPPPLPERGRPTARYHDDVPTHERLGNSRDDTRQPQGERLPGKFGTGLQPAANNSLQGRLGEKYDLEPERQRHELPPNPTLHRDHHKSHSPEARRKPKPPFLEPPRMRSDVTSGWTDKVPIPLVSFGEGAHRPHAIEDQNLSFPGRASRPPNPRRFGDSAGHVAGDGTDVLPQSPQNHLQERHPHLHQRPENVRRGGSLLDRLSLDQDGDARGDIHSPSLRDRVQVPSKRDREDLMMTEQYHGENSFDGDEGSMDPTFRRVRRRSQKMKRPRRP